MSLTCSVSFIFFNDSKQDAANTTAHNNRLIGILEKHESFLFSILKKNGYLFSGGDEKVVKYWKGSEVLGDLYHPNTIWDMACDENEDLITGNYFFYNRRRFFRICAVPYYFFLY